MLVHGLNLLAAEWYSCRLVDAVSHRRKSGNAVIPKKLNKVI